MTCRALTMAAVALLVGVLSAGAEEAENPAAAPTTPIPFKQFVDRTVDGVIVPGYVALSFGLARSVSMDDLCKRADAPALAAARADFALLVTAWSRVEMFRFGPAREDNRFERMFFWPDRRGLGLRQVQDLLAKKDESATKVETLRAKSVAVQGLLALEYVLYGDGSESLANGTADSYRCRYGRAIKGALAMTAHEMAEKWSSSDGFAAIMRDAGQDNRVYRSHGEVAQEILRSAREEIQLIRDLKLAAALGDTPTGATPKTAPFWRSNLTLTAIRANIATVLALLNAGGLGGILPAESDWLAGSLAFELGRADGALAEVESRDEDWANSVGDSASYRLLTYSLIPLKGALDLLEHDLPDTLGLTAGFNSLDGD